MVIFEREEKKRKKERLIQKGRVVHIIVALYGGGTRWSFLRERKKKERKRDSFKKGE